MVMLGTNQEMIETADGRFFVSKETENQRLQVALTQLTGLSLQCRTAPAGDRSAFERPISKVAKDVQRRIQQSTAELLVISGLRGQLDRLSEFLIVDDTVAVPRHCITGLSVNPHWYGDGHDVAPAVDLRIKSSYDFAGVYPEEDPGSWSQLSIATGSILLADYSFSS